MPAPRSTASICSRSPKAASRRSIRKTGRCSPPSPRPATAAIPAWPGPKARCGSAQYRERKIHQVDPETGKILRTIESNRFVTGVTWVDGELWHAHLGRRRERAAPHRSRDRRGAGAARHAAPAPASRASNPTAATASSAAAATAARSARCGGRGEQKLIGPGRVRTIKRATCVRKGTSASRRRSLRKSTLGALHAPSDFRRRFHRLSSSGPASARCHQPPPKAATACKAANGASRATASSPPTINAWQARRAPTPAAASILFSYAFAQQRGYRRHPAPPYPRY